MHPSFSLSMVNVLVKGKTNFLSTASSDKAGTKGTERGRPGSPLWEFNESFLSCRKYFNVVYCKVDNLHFETTNYIIKITSYANVFQNDVHK